MGNSLKQKKNVSNIEDLKEKKKPKRSFLPTLEVDTDFKFYLLGSQFSGKSTFYEQLENTIEEYTKEQKKEKIIHIQKFILSNILCVHDEPINIQTKESKDYFEHICQFYEFYDIIVEEGYEKNHPKIIKLFEESDIFEVLKKKDIETFHEKSSLHFFKNMYMFNPEVYIPTMEDVIHTRKFNSQFAKIMDYEFKNKTYRFIDQSGNPNIRDHYRYFNRNYNRKNHRDNKTPLFIMSSTDYFQMVTTYPENRLIDSLEYFGHIIEGRFYFKSDKVILILSKFDVFLKYYKENDLSKLFHGYKGGQDIKNMIDFIVNEFKKRTPKDVKLSVLIGDLTDSDQFNIMIEDVENIANGSLVIGDYRVYKTKEKFYFDESDLFEIMKKKYNRYSQCLKFHKLEDVNYIFRSINKF
eukprot:gene4876-8470_t